MLPHVICHHACVDISFNCLPDKHALYLEHFVPGQSWLMWYSWPRLTCSIWCHTCIPITIIFVIHLNSSNQVQIKMKTSFHKAEELIFLQEGLESDGLTPARVVSSSCRNHCRLPLCSLCKNSSVAPRNRACELLCKCT